MPEGVHVMRAEIGTTAAAKPLLRGHSHAVAAILAGLLIGVVSSFYPIVRASRLDPSEAVRYI